MATRITTAFLPACCHAAREHIFASLGFRRTARVGEHRDFEPGPVASLSIGERALFQFVTSRRIGERDAPLASQWLNDGSLQIFGGSFFKDRAFHRVQRVDKRAGISLPPEVDGFRTPRINFTFRYVPVQHVTPFADLGEQARADVRGYVEELAKSSRFCSDALVATTGKDASRVR